jgi:hypothetical protein
MGALPPFVEPMVARQFYRTSLDEGGHRDPRNYVFIMDLFTGEVPFQSMDKGGHQPLWGEYIRRSPERPSALNTYDLDDILRGYWIPDEGTLAFYEGYGDVEGRPFHQDFEVVADRMDIPPDEIDLLLVLT